MTAVAEPISNAAHRVGYPLRLDEGRRLRILMVEDDAALSESMAAGLADEGHEVVPCRSVADGRRLAGDSSFDVILLEVRVPDGNGFDLCRDLRRRGVGTPVIIVTGRRAVNDRVRGLDLGADDYLIKPFALAELSARIRAVDRRRRRGSPRQIRLGDFEADLATGVVRRRGRLIKLTVNESALLACFITHRDQIIDRAVIGAFVWGTDATVCPNVVESLVSRLRGKIDGPFRRKLVYTIRGAGYRFGL